MKFTYEKLRFRKLFLFYNTDFDLRDFQERIWWILSCCALMKLSGPKSTVRPHVQSCVDFLSPSRRRLAQ
jgi:hypothetical protein